MSGKCSLLLLLFGLLAACHTSLESGSTTISTPTTTAIMTLTSSAVASATPTLVPSPSLTPTPSPTRYATRRPRLASTPTNTPPTRTPTLRPTSAPVVEAPPGLIYSAGKAQWQITADGNPTLNITGTNSLISPNGQMAIKFPDCCHCNCKGTDQLVNLATGSLKNLEPGLGNAKWSADSKYIYYTSPRFKETLSDIWVYDVAAGTRRNLTNTPARDEDWMLDWPANSEFLAFYSTPGIPDGAGWIGYLTIMRTDGTGYQVVAKNPVSSPAAFSSDGHTIVYATYETIKHATYEESIVVPWYYRIGGQPQRFPWENFGLTKFKTMSFSLPSWSPDGQKIAWWMGGHDANDQERFGGVGIFDLALGTTVLFDNFAQQVWDGWPEAVQWSPDGKRIAFFGGHQQSEKHGDWGEFGIWTAQADGSHLRRLIDLSIEYNVCDWAWQPDGQWLAISCREHPEILPGIWLAELETGKLLKTNLPDDAQIRGWVNPRPEPIDPLPTTPVERKATAFDRGGDRVLPLRSGGS